MIELYEPHAHLYGCLEIDDLYWLARRNQPRWEIFTQSYRRTYGSEPKIEKLFETDHDSRRRLEEYYYFQSAGDFNRFQTCFDLIIALAATDPEELCEISKRITDRVDIVPGEYRMMFSPTIALPDFKQKVAALAEGFAVINSDTEPADYTLAISLARDPEMGSEQYRALREVQKNSRAAARLITGVDFCHFEEGHPPEEAAPLIQRIIKDNETEPHLALSILYHVGESYRDKTPESAVRWIVNAARLGAERLGHAVALGVNPELYYGTERSETAGERRGQLNFELHNLEELKTAGFTKTADRLQGELNRMEKLSDTDTIEIEYGRSECENLEAFQEWSMMEIKKSGAIIESCPTSNLMIAGLARPENHPLARFLKNGLSVALGSDDPGILRTSLEKEYERIAGWPGISAKNLSEIKRTALSIKEANSKRESQE